MILAAAFVECLLPTGCEVIGVVVNSLATTSDFAC
jgi:hypothetical protein